MIMRLAIFAAVFVAAAVFFALWKRAPKVARLDLADLGISGPAIVQFTTPYCAPCKTNRPHLVAAADAAGVRYAQIDLNERPDVMHRYGVRTAPTIIVAARNGRVLGTWTKLPVNGEIADAALVAASA